MALLTGLTGLARQLPARRQSSAAHPEAKGLRLQLLRPETADAETRDIADRTLSFRSARGNKFIFEGLCARHIAGTEF
jgi:hypothetical protein